MQGTVALRERGRLAALLNRITGLAQRQVGWRAVDARNVRTWRQLVLGVLVRRSTRLLGLGQATLGQRRAGSAKAGAQGLGYFLARAAFPIRPWSARLLEVAVGELPATRLVTYRGKALVVIDPTEYAKRSRGRGRRGRQMEHVGRVRAPRPKAGRRSRATRASTATAAGYLDVWAGLVLRRQQFLPLARHLFSRAHPRLASQNRVEEAVLFQALGLLRRAGFTAIVIGDRGLGRKELLVRLAHRRQAFVFRIDADVLVCRPGTDRDLGLTALLAAQDPLGEVVWNRGEQGPLRCAVRATPATFRFSRTGRRADRQEATLSVVELRPLDCATEPLVLATTLPVTTRTEAKGIAWVYGQRWAVETAFETMKAWGLGAFMVRAWTAIDRLLWVLALAYALAVLALRDPRLGHLRTRACALLRQQATLGRRLTPGKLAEALGLDFAAHRRAWASCWLS